MLNPADPNRANWKQIVLKYQKPVRARALWQLANTLVPYAGLWCLMYWSVSVSLWLTAPLVVLAGAFLVRVFIVFHDCGHGSFFSSRRANDFVGRLTGLLAFAPYVHWRWQHAIHHSSAGDLDRRGTGDVWTMTVAEYLRAPRWKRFAYRLARNPFVLFGVAPLWLFFVSYRLPSSKAGKRERRSVAWTNLGIVLLGAGLASIFGLKHYLLLQLGVLLVAGMAGVWLFYVQHQFEGVYWEHGADWSYCEAALKGSSFYKLPKILQWFSGNIGYHHIHHLGPRIPNYLLEKCHRAETLFQSVPPVTLWSSLKSLSFRLWDEQRQRLVGYGALRSVRGR